MCSSKNEKEKYTTPSEQKIPHPRNNSKFNRKLVKTATKSIPSNKRKVWNTNVVIEAVYRRRSDNAMTKRKGQEDKVSSTKHYTEN